MLRLIPPFPLLAFTFAAAATTNSHSGARSVRVLLRVSAFQHCVIFEITTFNTY